MQMAAYFQVFKILLLICAFLLFFMFYLLRAHNAKAIQTNKESRLSTTTRPPTTMCSNHSGNSLVKSHIDVNSNKTHIGILIPATTRNIKFPALANLTLYTECIPSILNTMEEKYDYTIYIGIDLCDYLETKIDDLEQISPIIKPIVVKGGSFTKAVNEIARIAYDDGVHYFLRMNDDTVLMTGNWTSMGIQALLNYSPSNVGVVGPTCHEGNTKVLTTDMVHRTHFQLYGHYYPPEFDNWWTDDWITKVYQPHRSTKLAAWLVKHKLVNTRYSVDYTQRNALGNVLDTSQTFMDSLIPKAFPYFKSFLRKT